jgi:hypothetical protein
MFWSFLAALMAVRLLCLRCAQRERQMPLGRGLVGALHLQACAIVSFTALRPSCLLFYRMNNNRTQTCTRKYAKSDSSLKPFPGSIPGVSELRCNRHLQPNYFTCSDKASLTSNHQQLPFSQIRGWYQKSFLAQARRL